MQVANNTANLSSDPAINGLGKDWAGVDQLQEKLINTDPNDLEAMTVNSQALMKQMKMAEMKTNAYTNMMNAMFKCINKPLEAMR